MAGRSVGAGLEYAFTDTVFGRVEYRYNDYGSKTIWGTDVDLDQHVVSAGIGVKF
jgi:outer membrane immunogenic protein